MFLINGGFGFKFFMIDGDYYLVVVEFYDCSIYLIDFLLYKWKRGRFEKYQNFLIYGGVVCDLIVIVNDIYFVFVN